MANSLFQWLTLAVMSLAHPYFISVTDINHNASTKELEISIRIFTDDLENTLKMYTKDKVDLINPLDKSKMDKLVNDYISRNVKIKVNGKDVVMEFAGYEISDASTWSYFEIKNITSVKDISVTNSLLHDYKKEQINILDIKANNKEENTKLDYPNTEASFHF